MKLLVLSVKLLMIFFTSVNFLSVNEGQLLLLSLRSLGIFSSNMTGSSSTSTLSSGFRWW